jgi:hypothetical protein
MSLKFRLLAGLMVMLAAGIAPAASLTAQIVLVDDLDNPIPQVNGGYQVLPGQQFRVQLLGQVLSPNFTDTARTGSTMDNKALGIQNIVGQLRTSAVNSVNPVSAGGSPPKWQGFVEKIGLGSPGFVNLLDVDSDGDLDPSGAGAANSSLSISSSLFLSTVQLGALGQEVLFEGRYVAQSAAPTQLTFVPTTVKIYADVVGGTDNNALFVEDGLSTFVTTPIFINVPEPTGIALAGLGMFGMIAIARRRVRPSFTFK